MESNNQQAKQQRKKINLKQHTHTLKEKNEEKKKFPIRLGVGSRKENAFNECNVDNIPNGLAFYFIWNEIRSQFIVCGLNFNSILPTVKKVKKKKKKESIILQPFKWASSDQK